MIRMYKANYGIIISAGMDTLDENIEKTKELLKDNYTRIIEDPLCIKNLTFYLIKTDTSLFNFIIDSYPEEFI